MSRRHPSSFQLPIRDDNCGIQRDRKRESLQVTAVPGTRLQSRPKKCCPKQLKHPSRLCSGEGSSLRKDASDSTHSGLLSGQGTLPVPFGTLNPKPKSTLSQKELNLQASDDACIQKDRVTLQHAAFCNMLLFNEDGLYL